MIILEILMKIYFLGVIIASIILIKESKCYVERCLKRDYTKYDIALYVLYVLIAAWSSWYTIYKYVKTKDVFIFWLLLIYFKNTK